MDITWSGVVELLGGLGIAGGGYFVKQHDTRLEKAESNVQAVSKQLYDHMISSQKQWTEAEQRYAKEESVQQTLARLHDRLDNTATKDDVDAIRENIIDILKSSAKS